MSLKARWGLSRLNFHVARQEIGLTVTKGTKGGKIRRNYLLVGVQTAKQAITRYDWGIE